MARFSKSDLDTILARLASGARESARGAARFAARPPFLEEKLDAATRVGQWMAALLLPMLIVVSLALITAFHQLLAGIFGATGDLGNQSDLFAFLITGITLGTFILVAYTWFLFVRTAGFGMFAMED